MEKRQEQITVLRSFKFRFEEMCKYFNIKVREIANAGKYAIYEFKNGVLDNNNSTKEELLHFIKDIYEKALLEK